MSESYVALSEAESAVMYRNIKPWRKPTIAQIRNCVLNHQFLTPHDPARAEEGKRLANLSEAFVIGVQAGRLFDMGHLPNQIIKAESIRAGELFFDGHIGHPFRQPYCLYHTWDSESVGDEATLAKVRELDIGDTGSLYLVDAMDWHGASGGKIPKDAHLICEAQAVQLFGKGMLLIGDSVLTWVVRKPDGTTGPVGHLTRGVVSTNVDDASTAGNLTDPVMACLLLLATDGVEVVTVEAPDRLNKQRVKNGKLAIPSHYDVRTVDYVTALSSRYTRKRGPSDGHHASPIPHRRRGHKRTLHEMHGGNTIWVRDALINLKDPEAPLARSFYQRRLDEEHKPTVH